MSEHVVGFQADKEAPGATHTEIALVQGTAVFFPANPGRKLLILCPRGESGIEFGLGEVEAPHGVPIKPHDTYDFSGNPPPNAFWLRSTYRIAPTVIIEG